VRSKRSIVVTQAMPITGLVPDWLFSIVAAATVVTIMFSLGLAILPGDFRWAFARPGLMLRSLFAVLVAVPVLAWLVARAFDLPRAAEVGILLMAISPGAPVALRRSLRAGGHRSFAPALQIAVSALAVVSMPLSLAGFDEYYGAQAVIAPRHLATQVFVVQRLPFGLGIAMARFLPNRAAAFDRRLGRLGGALLAVLLALAVVDIWRVVIGAQLRVALAIVVVTTLALAVGHVLGGPEPSTRTAAAISSAARNPGLAVLAATLNHASPAVTAAVLAYLFIGALTLIPYAAWRRRVPGAAATTTRSKPREP
jgi:BASS family bile acid:Na+ symporter